MLCQFCCCCSLSCVQLICDPMDCSLQAPLSMGLPRQKYQSGLPLSSLGDLLDPETELMSPELAGKFFTTEPPGKPLCIFSVQLLSHVQLCNPMDCSTPGFPIHHQLPKLAQTHVHWVGDAIQPSHPLSSPCPPALNLSQHQILFQLVSSSHQVAKILALQLQYQSFQWIFRADLL